MIIADGAGLVGVGIIFLFWVLLIVVALGGFALGIWGLIDSMGKPDWAWTQAGENRTTYLVLFVLGFVVCQLISFIAAIIYFRSVKPKLLAAMAAGPSPYWQGGYGAAGGYAQPGYPQPGYPPSAYPPAGAPGAPGGYGSPPGFGQPAGPPSYGAPGAPAAPPYSGPTPGAGDEGETQGPIQF